MEELIGRLKNLISYYTSLKIHCAKKLTKLPQGTLSINKCNGKLYYFKTVAGKREYLGSTHNEEVVDLTKRHFYKAYSSILETNLSLLNKCVKGIKETDPSRIIQGFPEKYRNVPETIINEMGFTAPFDGKTDSNANGYMESGLKHFSATGIPMRSKSEVAIANMYTSMRIDFAYEKVLILPSGRELLPDFTLRSADGRRIIYHEHAGMMNDPDYRARFYQKFRTYMDEGLVPMQDVIFTFDDPDGGIDLNKILKIVQFYL